MKIHQVFVALDQLVNTLIGGWADETLSARAYRMSDKSRRWAKARKLIDWLFFWEQQHCQWAWMAERARTQLPVEYREA